MQAWTSLKWLGALALVSASACDNSPTYQGKTASLWAMDLDAKFEFERLRACKALTAIGQEKGQAVSDFVPAIDKLVHHENQELSAAALGALATAVPQGHAVLSDHLRSENHRVRLGAVEALWGSRVHHEAASQSLARLLVDSSSPRFESAHRFAAGLGDQALPLLRAVLSSERSTQKAKERTLASLAGFGAAAGEMSAMLKELIDREEHDVRANALRTFVSVSDRQVSKVYLGELLERGDADPRIASLSAYLLRGLKDDSASAESLDTE